MPEREPVSCGEGDGRPPAAAPHRHRVLVVEDNEDLRGALTTLLRLEDLHVTEACDVAAALAVLGREPPPCLILLDFMMPGADGSVFRREQMRNQRLAAIPTVLFSAYDGIAQKAAELGIDEVLPKLVDFDALAAVIARRCPGTAG